MLTEIRDRSTGVFAWFIAGLIIIPMAFFGVSQYASTEARPTIVQVGEQKITQQDYQSRLAQAQTRARESNPSLANSDVLNSEFYKKQVLQGMVDQAVNAHIGNQYNYQFGDKAIDKVITEDPTFQTDGKFDQSLYNVFAASRGRAGAEQIRADIRSASIRQQVVSGFSESALVLPNEVRELLEIQTERRTFDLITIKQSDFNDKVVVSEADIEQYYTSNIEQYMLPDRTSVSYIELDKAIVAQGLTIEESRLEALYDEYREGFIADETRTTSHILLNTGGDNDDDAQKAKIEDLASQLAAGADFAELAKANSQDPGSAQNGGSLGDVARDEMVDEFNQAMFELAEGEVSSPVKTEFGYHLILVDKINATEAESFDILRTDLEFEERERLAEELVIEQAEQLRNGLFEQPDSLDGVAQELGLSVLTTDLFSLEEGTGIAINQPVRASAFSQQVQSDNVNSELIEIADGVYVALRKLTFAPSEPKKLAVVSAEIKSALTTERAIAAAKEAGDSVITRAESDWAGLANDSAVEISTYTTSMIDTTRTIPGDVLREVIKMRLDDTATTVSSFSGINGDFNVVRLTQIAPGNLSAVSQQVKDATRSLIEQRNGQSLYGAYVKGLGDELAVDINQDLL
ncbi:MAG: peptidyl-prolyl cis-trans isomerase D [Arenicella sp.]|jgi:peptidyl-prolyl cis-trans isomerase D